MTHTPGPWKFCESDDARVPDRIVSQTGVTIASGTVGVNRADAALISAAPDMLAALETMLAYWDKGSFHPAIDQACAAISRAKGQA